MPEDARQEPWWKRARVGTWRQKVAPIIAKLIAENKNQPIDEIRAALLDKWMTDPDLPEGKKDWPYRVWLDESRCQLGLKKRLMKDYPTPLLDGVGMIHCRLVPLPEPVRRTPTPPASGVIDISE